MNVERQSSYSKEELLRMAQGKLPGFEGAKLPSPPMLMVSRIIKISKTGGKFEKGEIIAEMDIDPSLWFFDCHFKDDPVMPGCLGLDALWQLTGFFLSWCGGKGIGRALGCDEVKFKGQVRPHHKKIDFRISIRKILKKPIALVLADGMMEVEGREIYFAKKLRVGLFENLTYPPPEGEVEPF
ncbi:MAG: bifunctional 3-hydroxydecanoyl-ACP dehydratase/trans-2-decenoyl-ACP isomerase [Candidatus Marinimicrobia bacterium]|nr:bifunctional 3-hydroxydecanoyl-ACP dehydratase/trans-2-decenoyl-ACP isomerase [Candidatus Neomarinimicrobiota bacterium]